VAVKPKAIRISIYDQEYQMRADLDPEYVRSLGEFVDSKMRSIASRTQTVDTLRVAILTALNIADEYHQLRARTEAATKRIEQRVDECSEVVDQLLDHADSTGSSAVQITG
jgi:cell division protein ZapA